jgi:hypothetical protein
LEGFHVAIYPGGYMGGIYSARDIPAFHMMLVVQYGELKLVNS